VSVRLVRADRGPRAAATASSSLFVLGPAAFDPTDDDALSCPLVVRADHGQHVNLTLYDFAATSHGVAATSNGIAATSHAATSRHDHAVDDYSGYDQVRRCSITTLGRVSTLLTN